MKYKYIHTILQYLSFITLFLYLFFSPLSANSQIRLEDNISTYSDFKVDFYAEKPEESMGIDKISQVNFTEQISNQFSLGYKKNDFWFHFTLFNDSDDSREMVVELTEIIHKHVDLYVMPDPVTKMENGLSIPVNERAIQESVPSFPLRFLPYEKKEIYLHLSSIYGVFGAILIKTQEQYDKDIQFKKDLYLFYFTVIITIVLYNLLLFLYLRENVYLLYIGHVIVFLVWALNYKGVLLPYTNMIIYDLLQMTIPVFFTLLILFSQRILETKKIFPFLHKILNGFIVVSFISFILMVISMHIGFEFMNIVAAPLLPFLFFVAFWALYKHHNVAKIYLIALTVYISGMILISLLALGILPYSITLSYSAMIGSFFEVIFFSLLLAYRINLVRKEVIESEKKLHEQQKTESSRLFHTVAEKTKALNLANKQLEKELAKKEALEKHLKHLASTDPMTELLNRRAFFDVCDKTIKRVASNDEELTCLIIDIDHFKKINDTYGHDAGDEVIITIAKLIIDNTRTMDFIGRIGGEEFSILMPNTDKESAFIIADRLRENVAKHKILLDSAYINITVSIGLSYLTHEDVNIHTLLKRADTALYEAKESGRNQVCYL